MKLRADRLSPSPVQDALGYRALAYLLLTIVVGAFATSIIFEGSTLKASEVFFLFSFVSFTNVVALFIYRDEKTLESVLFSFFLADAAVAMLLVRSSGASASPFLVLFPLMTLAGAMLFGNVYARLLAVGNLLFMVGGVGFGFAIVGNAIAILLTSFLGSYLVQALEKSGRALKVSEGARRRLENLQKAILANIPSGLMSVDTQGRIIQINGIGLKILNRSETEILSSHIRDLLPDIADTVVRVGTEVPTESSPVHQENRRRTLTYALPDGQRLDLGYSIARLKDPIDRSPLGALVVFQDLTLITRMEENLRLSEKLAAVGKLAAGIAHEIRNPLAGISGSAQLLSGSDELNLEDKKLLNIIQRESNRLDLLITEFLEYVRPAKPKFENVPLRKVAEQVIESLRVNPKWLALKCEVTFHPDSQNDLRAWGDGNKIIQVLMNFLMNAGQAGATRVELCVQQIKGRPVLDIRDNGKGIDPKHQPHLFEPFFTTKESGTGLGLAISYRVLESMRAHVEVRSPLPEFCESGGTLFRLDFQYSEEEMGKKSA